MDLDGKCNLESGIEKQILCASFFSAQRLDISEFIFLLFVPLPRHRPVLSPGTVFAFQRVVLSETEYTQVSLALMTAGQAVRC